MTKYKCLYEITGRIEDVATFLVPLKDLPKQTVEHWSDCAVNSEPAYPAGECDCGGFKQYQDEGMCQACEFGQCTAKAGCVAISNPPPKQEQGEPVAVVIASEYEDGSHAGNHLEWCGRNEANDFPVGTKFYTTPQQRTWVGLTDDERNHIWNKSNGDVLIAIEAKLKEKNT
jgi:hypothetical protein